MSIYYLPPNALPHLPADIWNDLDLAASIRATVPATVYDAHTGGALADPGDAIGRIEDGTINSIDLKQSSTSLRPVFGRRPVTGRRNLAPVSEPTVSDLSASGDVVNGDFGGSLGLINGIYFADNAAVRFAYVSVPVVPNTTYCLSVFIKMDDGLAPRINVDNINGDLRLVLYSSAASDNLIVSDLGAGVYRISAVRTENTNDFFFGVVKYTTQSARGFTVTGFQIDVGSAPTDYQKVGASGLDVTEAGVDTVHYTAFDLIDDKLATDAITGGITGQAFVAGAGGCYVTDLTIADGGTFEIGRLSSALLDTWTDAPMNVLAAVAGVDEQVFDALLRSGNFTDEEIARLEAYYIARGGKGLLVEGPEEITNGTFNTDIIGWSDATSAGTGSISWNSGAMQLNSDGVGNRARGAQSFSTTVGAAYLLQYDSTLNHHFKIGTTENGFEIIGFFNQTAGSKTITFIAAGTTCWVTFEGFNPAGSEPNIDNVSVKRLIPREEL